MNADGAEMHRGDPKLWVRNRCPSILYYVNRNALKKGPDTDRVPQTQSNHPSPIAHQNASHWF